MSAAPKTEEELKKWLGTFLSDKPQGYTFLFPENINSMAAPGSFETHQTLIFALSTRRVRASSLQALFKDKFGCAIDYISLGYRKLSLALTAWSDTVQCQFDVDRDLIIYPTGIPLPSPDAPSNPVSSSRNPKLPSSNRSDPKRPFAGPNVPAPYPAPGWRGQYPGQYPGGGPWNQGPAWNGGGYDSMGPKDWYGGGYASGRSDNLRPRQDPARSSTVL